MCGLLAEGQVAAPLGGQLQRPLGLVEGDVGLDAAGRRHRHPLAARRQHGRCWSPSSGRLLGRGAVTGILVQPLQQVAHLLDALGNPCDLLAHAVQLGLLLGAGAALVVLQRREPDARLVVARLLGLELLALGAAALDHARRLFSSLASPTACALSSGNAEDSSMALRTMVNASSRRVIITGGGLRPILCRAASSAEIAPWRCSSVPRSCLSSTSSSAELRLDLARARPRSAGCACRSRPAGR